MKKLVTTFICIFGTFLSDVFAQRDTLTAKEKSEYVIPPSFLTGKEWTYAISVLVFTLIIILILNWGRYNKHAKPISDGAYLKLMTLSLTVGAMMFFIVAGYDTVQLQPFFALLSTLAAYLLGQQGAKKENHGS